MRSFGGAFGAAKFFLLSFFYLCVMLVYNITFKVDLDSSVSFLDFLEQYTAEHALDFELFQLANVDDSDGFTYCLHQKFSDLGTYNRHIVVIDRKFKEQIIEKYGDKVLFFGSILNKVK